MKARLSKAALASATKWVGHAIPMRPATPVLAGLHLRADGDTLTLTGFDYDASARRTLPAEVIEPGEALVPGTSASAMVAALPDGELELVIDDDAATVECGGVSFTMPSMAVHDYPALPTVPDPLGELDGPEFAEVIQRVSYAVSTSIAVPHFTGVLLDVAGDTAAVVASDRYRMPILELPWTPIGEPTEFRVIVPRKVLDNFAKVDQQGSVLVGVSDPTGQTGVVGLYSGGNAVTSSLIAADYPPWASLIPSADGPVVAEIPAKPLEDALKRASLVLPELIPATFTFAPGGVSLDARDGAQRATETIPAEVVCEAEMSAKFNPRYMLAALKAAKTPKVRLTVHGPTKAALLTPVDGDGYRHILMPVRIG